MHTSFQRSIGTIVLIAVVCKSPYVDAKDSDDHSATHWSVGLGAQYDKLHRSTMDANVGYTGTADASWLLDINRNYLPGANSDITSNAASLGFYHRGYRVGMSFGVNTVDDVGLVDANEAKVSVPVHGENWRVTFEGRVRHSGFDPFRVNTTVKLRTGNTVAVNGTATCTLNNLGYAVEIGLDGALWTGYMKAVQYHYDDNDCGFDSAGLDALKKANPQEFRQLSATLTRRLATLGASHLRLNTQGSYLAAEWEAGLNYAASHGIWGVVYQHGRDQFESLTSDSYGATATFEVLTESDIELQIGSRHSQSIGTAAYLGLQFTTRF
jgi:opacity protein-like surface antigen